nr:hypothetical protein [Tanacetum cinerariifolium]
MHTERGDGVTGFKRRRRGLSSDDVMDVTAASGRSRLKPALVDSTWRRHDLESDDKSVDTPLVSPFLDSDDDSDDGEVLNELEEYGNAEQLCRQREINSFDGDELAFQCMVGFRKFVAYFDPFLPMNIITHKAYNTIMVEGLESTGKNLVAII